MISKTLLILGASLVLCTCGEAQTYQNIDPYRESVRRSYELRELGRQRDEEQRRERLRQLSEQAYDRQACIKKLLPDFSSYGTLAPGQQAIRGPQTQQANPDIEQCVRDSAYFRRCGPGGCAPVTLPPELHCQTVDYGGVLSTDCF